MLLDAGQKDGAMQLAELWHRLLPEELSIREYYYLARVSVAKNRPEMEAVLDEIKEQMDQAASSGADLEEKKTEVYKKALTRAWERLGYPGELAKIRTELIYTKEMDELEWLAERAKDCRIRGGRQAQAYKVLGDIRSRQGQTAQAYKNYLEAAKTMEHSYVRTELSRIFLTDLYEGSKKARVYAANGDASDFLEQWLGKYESIEALQELVKKLVFYRN